MGRELLVGGLVGIFAAVFATPGLPADELEEEHDLTTAYVTPHVPWGKDLAGGPVRGLFFVTGRGGNHGSFTSLGTAPREVVELAQRFDIEPTAVFMQANVLHRGEEGEKRLLRLLEQPFEVYVFGNANYEALPREAQYHILERVVRQGAGLVCVGRKPERIFAVKRARRPPFALLSGLPVAALAHAEPMKEALGLTAPTSPELAARLLTPYRLGKGRGLWVNYPGGPHALTPKMTFSFPALTEYEYWQLFIGRAILWAAGREGEVLLTEILGEGLTFDRSQLPSDWLPVRVQNLGPQALRLQLHFTLRRAHDGWTKRLPPAEVTVQPGQTRTPGLRLPVLRTGQYYLDVLACSERGVEAFGAGAFQVTSPRGVERVELDQPFAEEGETITGTVVLRGEGFTSQHALRVQLRTSDDRVLARQEFPRAPEGKQVRFSFPIGRWATILLRAEAVLLKDGQEVDLGEASFTVPQRRRGQFNFIMWDRPSDLLGYWAYRKLRDAAGISVCLVGGEPGPVLQACDIAQIPYTTRILDRYDENGHMQPVCWNDEPRVEEYVQSIVEKYLPSRQHGVFVYSLGDETTTKGCCLHPACLEAYRRYLREQYGTIEALNESWGSNYRSFAEVQLLDPKDNWENAALRQGLTARWYDRQAFARYNFAQFCGRFVRAYARLDPRAVTGFEGAGRFGDDFEAIITTNGFWSPYPSLADEILRSLAPREFIRSNWMGYQKTADPLVAVAWRMVCNGCDSVWWWRWDGIGRFHGYLRPTLDLWPATAELAEEMRIVREGLGDWLLHAQRVDGTVALLYSLPSTFAPRLHNSGEFGDPAAMHQAWVSVTKDLGVPFRYLTPRLLTEGVLASGKFKVLVLPFVQALGPAQAEAIRQFVEGGGTVIADLRPGVYTPHCRATPPGVLSDLFGVRQTVPGQPQTVTVSLAARIEGQELRLHLEEVKADAALEPTDARAWGQADGVPLMLTKGVGRGRAFLLNFPLTAYEGKRQEAESDQIRSFVRGLYALAGVTPPLEMETTDGEPLRATEATLWEAGPLTMLALRPDPGRWRWSGPEGAEFRRRQGRITLPQPRHVYDLRQGKYLGKVRSFTTELYLGRANFFALLPAPVPGLRLTVAPQQGSPGGTLRVQVQLTSSAPSAGLYAVFLTGTAPDGSRPRWLQKVLLLREGRAETTLRLAYNDPLGVWQLRAQELFSRRTVSTPFQIRP